MGGTVMKGGTLYPYLRHLDPSCLKAGAQETATNMQHFSYEFFSFSEPYNN
jgi:hypothetical protein